MVRLIVSGDQRECIFFVHSKLLITASPFFRNALQGGWKETKEQCIKLPADSPLAVNAYVHFLYTGSMNIESVYTGKPNDGTVPMQEQALALLLYTFAEKIQDIRAKNEAVKVMSKSICETRIDGKLYFPGPMTIRNMYVNTLPGCSMRKMVVDAFAYNARVDSITFSKVVPKEFFFDLAVACIQLRSRTARTPFVDSPRQNIAKYLEKEQ